VDNARLAENEFLEPDAVFHHENCRNLERTGNRFP